MKKSKELSNFHNQLLSQFENIDVLISEYKKKIKKEYQQIMIDEKNKLLSQVAEGEKLNVNELKKKYLKSKEIITTDEEVKVKQIEDNEELLDQIVIEEEIYYYENKEKGKVFDINSNEVGIFKNGSILMSNL
jgi:hypothetical protein